MGGARAAPKVENVRQQRADGAAAAGCMGSLRGESVLFGGGFYFGSVYGLSVFDASASALFLKSVFKCFVFGFVVWYTLLVVGVSPKRWVFVVSVCSC